MSLPKSAGEPGHSYVLTLVPVLTLRCVER
jgi:hypothetical protein